MKLYSLPTQQRGQAMSEFVVAMLVLLPFFIIVPHLAQYIDVSHNATTASRFAGFESSLNHKIVNGTSELLDYDGPWASIFSDAQGVRKTEEKEMTEKIKKYFFNNPSGKALVSDVTATREYEADNTKRQLRNIGWKHNVMNDFAGFPGFGLGTQEFRIAEVNIMLKPLPWQADVSGPSGMRRYTVVSYNDWSATGPKQVKHRVLMPGRHYPRPDIRMEDGSLLMTGMVGALTTPTDAYGAPLPMPLIALLNMEFHTVIRTQFSVDELFEVDVENVPGDRLR